MIFCSVNGQAFFIVLMKRKKILKEEVPIPYRLDDFKPGDRLHIIGDYDDDRSGGDMMMINMMRHIMMMMVEKC